MKVLQIASGDFFSTYGGGQVYVKNIVDEFIRQGRLQVAVCSFVGAAQPGIYVKKNYNGIDLYELNEGADETLLRQLVLEAKPDVMHAHSHKDLACRIGQELGIPVVVTSHHGGIVCPAGTLMNCQDTTCKVSVSHHNCLKCCLRGIRSGVYWYPFMKWMPASAYQALGKGLRKLPFVPFITPIGQTALSIQGKQKQWQEITKDCTLMIAPCHELAEAMVRNGLSEDKIKVVPHGIPLPERVAPFMPVEDGKVKFFYVGRICYVKGIHILLEAFSRLSVKGAELHLIGGAANKGERRYEAQLKKKYGDDSRIVWHGKVKPEEVFGMIQNYHVSSSSSYVEAFGLNIAESLAMGKPVLATRNGGAEMQITDGVNGWLVPQNDVEAMHEKMEEICRTLKAFDVEKATAAVVSIAEHCKELYNGYIRMNRNGK